MKEDMNQIGNKRLEKRIEILPGSQFLNKFSFWNIRTMDHPWKTRYGVVILSCLIILIVKLYFDHVFKESHPFFLFSSAIVISAAYGGFGPGLFATLLSFFSIELFFFAPYTILVQHSPGQNVFLFLFLLQGLFISCVSHIVHMALRKADKQRMQLMQSQQYFRLIVETVQDYAIYTTNSEGYITSWNEGARRLKGYDSDEVLGRHFSLFYTPEEIEIKKPWNDLNKAAELGRSESEVIKKKKDGSTFFAHVVITAVRDEQGKLYGFSHISQDMTRHKELDMRKDEFISIASHELKTPLTSIKILNDLLKKLAEKSNNREAVIYLGKMATQINKLTDLINTLLDVSKIQAGKLAYRFELFDINDLVRDIVDNFQMLSYEHSITVEGKTYGKVKGDKDRIGQVVTNFLTNAIKYSPIGGMITVSIMETKQNVTIAVKDSGIGIAENEQKKIFKRFYRADGESQKYPGLGIGLYISSEIIRQHNGIIGVKSQKGNGSTFYFTLPY